MERVGLKLIPLPFRVEGQQHDGMIRRAARRCERCPAPCESSDSYDLSICSYGYDFIRVDETLLLAGFVVRGHSNNSQARGKAVRQAKGEAVERELVTKVVTALREIGQSLDSEIEREKLQVVANYRKSREFLSDVVDAIRPDLQHALAQVHDYKQFVQQINQNMVVMLEERFPGVPIDSKLAQASHEERAIYWAAQLMDEKLDAAGFLANPEYVTENPKLFRFHGAVTKHLKIYKHRIEQKRVRVHEIGDSWGSIFANPRAVPIVPHAILDNAVKYAPEGSDITIRYAERDGKLDFSVESLGPTMTEDELTKVFDPFFRGSNARATSVEGSGIGLAAAQLVANKLGARIEAEQDDHEESKGMQRTVFSVSFDLADDETEVRTKRERTKQRR